MGVRAASLTTLTLEAVRIPAGNVLGSLDGTTYAECVRLSRLAWCALSVGVGQAVLDYVTPYVKEHPVERWYRDLRAISIMEGGVLV